GGWVSGLRSRLLMLLLLAIVPALVLAVDSGTTERQLAEDVAHEAALNVTRNAAATLARHIDDAHDVLAVLAATTDLPSASASACDAQLSAVHGRLQERGTTYTVLSVVAPDGSLLCNSPPLTEPVSIADRLHFRLAIE